ncbi:MAG: universal stress protein [Anaerovoracaceae bacterium]|jgi:nucleotide-binding universal stress UspA family protein
MKILIPVDGSQHSNRAIGVGKEYATAMDASIILINVMGTAIPESSSPTFDYKDYVDTLKQNSEHILSNAKKLIGDDIEVKTVSVTGNPSQSIAEYAKKNNIDLIIIGSHGQGSALQRFFVGSVTAKALTLVETPMLVVK